MGSMAYLTIGSFEINWGKNNVMMMHGELFQSRDVMLVPDIYVGDEGELITKMQQGASKPLAGVLPRLDLLGFTLEAAREDFESVMQMAGCEEPPISFEELAASLKAMDVDAAAADYHDDYDFGEFFAREIFDRLGLRKHVTDQHGARYELGQIMENLHPYSVLRLLAENPVNLSRPVMWHYNDVVENGWVELSTISANVGSARRFLIVTEGSSDAHIIERALALLRPDTADFFTFVDMEDGYPFTGTGNLHRFCQGLAAIGIENRVIVLYDNDLEGALRCEDTSRLNLPSSMRVTKLPSLPELSSFQTLGPDGIGVADINGKAAAIECYLDLAFGTEETPQVRWSSYNDKADSYQGALMYKETYTRRFLKLRYPDPAYDFNKLEAILDHMFAVCFSVAESAKLAELRVRMGETTSAFDPLQPSL